MHSDGDVAVFDQRPNEVTFGPELPSGPSLSMPKVHEAKGRLDGSVRLSSGRRTAPPTCVECVECAVGHGDL